MANSETAHRPVPYTRPRARPRPPGKARRLIGRTWLLAVPAASAVFMLTSCDSNGSTRATEQAAATTPPATSVLPSSSAPPASASSAVSTTPPDPPMSLPPGTNLTCDYGSLTAATAGHTWSLLNCAAAAGRNPLPTIPLRVGQTLTVTIHDLRPPPVVLSSSDPFVDIQGLTVTATGKGVATVSETGWFCRTFAGVQPKTCPLLLVAVT